MQNSPSRTRLRQKQPRLMLDAKPYDTLRKSVLERDGWRCQVCGSMKNLQVHHIQHRSQLGDDAMENLIALCSKCHRQCHRQ